MQYEQSLISFADLTAVMTESNIKQSVRRGTIKRAIRGCRGQEAMFVIDSLPERYKQEVIRTFPHLIGEQKKPDIMDKITIDLRAIAYYSDFALPDGRHLTADKQSVLSNNASILRSLSTMLRDSDAMAGRLGSSKIKRGDFWQRMAEAIADGSISLPNTLPKNARSLSRLYQRFVAEGYGALITKKFGNSDAAKVATEAQRSALMLLISNPNNLNDEQICKAYNHFAQSQEPQWPGITRQTVANWRARYSLETSAARLGSNNFDNTRQMQVKRTRPTAALAMVSMDGWTVELLYQATHTDKKGHNVTTYSNRLTLVVLIDVMNDYPLGYAIGEGESPDLIRQAIQNAIDHTRHLFGHWHILNQLQCDNYQKKALMPTYALVADKVTPARVGNAKAKPVEPYFSCLNTTYCQLMDNWSGFGVTTNPLRQPNAESLNMRRKGFPDRAGCEAQIHAIMAKERARKADAYIRAYGNLDTDHRLEMTRERYLMAFGQSNGRTYTLQGTGITATLGGSRIDYDCFDLTFRQHADQKWTLRIDANDLSTVMAESADGQYRYILERKYEQPMALIDRTEEATAELQRVRNFKKQVREHVTETLANAACKVEEIIRENPNAIDTTVSRLMICDSKGQHKDHKTERRKALENGERSDESGEIIDDYDIF